MLPKNPHLVGRGKYNHYLTDSIQEVDEWCRKLHASPLISLVKPFGIIADWHRDGDHTYTFNDEGMQVYRIFADEMAQITVGIRRHYSGQRL